MTAIERLERISSGIVDVARISKILRQDFPERSPREIRQKDVWLAAAKNDVSERELENTLKNKDRFAIRLAAARHGVSQRDLKTEMEKQTCVRTE